MNTRLHDLLPAGLLGLAALALLAAPAGAFDVPQTRAEFVRAVAAGRRGVKMETSVVDRGFEQVMRSLQARTTPCLDVVVNRSGWVGDHTEVSSSDYNPTLKRVGDGRGEFSLQVVNRPRGLGAKPPAGGLYVMAADIRRAGAARTEVVLYRPSMGYKAITKQFMAWADGSSEDCPKLR